MIFFDRDDLSERLSVNKSSLKVSVSIVNVISEHSVSIEQSTGEPISMSNIPQELTSSSLNVRVPPNTNASVIFWVTLTTEDGSQVTYRIQEILQTGGNHNLFFPGCHQLFFLVALFNIFVVF